jgi:hypothetical protein
MKNRMISLLLVGCCLFLAANCLVAQATWSLTNSQLAPGTVNINYAGFPQLTPAVAGTTPRYQTLEIFGSGDYIKRDELLLGNGYSGSWSFPNGYSYPNSLATARTYQPVLYYVSRKDNPPPSAPPPIIGNPFVTTGNSSHAQQPQGLPNGRFIALDTSYHTRRGLKTAFIVSYKPEKKDGGKIYLFFNGTGTGQTTQDFDNTRDHKPNYSSQRSIATTTYTTQAMPFRNNAHYSYSNWEGLNSGQTLRHFIELTNQNGTDGTAYKFMAVLTQENAGNNALVTSGADWALLAPYLTGGNGNPWLLDEIPVVDYTVITMKSGHPTDPNKLTITDVCACGDENAQVTFRYKFCNDGTATAKSANIEFSNMFQGLFSHFGFLSSTNAEIEPPVMGDGNRPWRLKFNLPNGMMPLSITQNEARSCGTVTFTVCANKQQILDSSDNLTNLIKGCTSFDGGEGGTVCILNHEKGSINLNDIKKCLPIGACCGGQQQPSWRWWLLGLFGAGAFGYYFIKKAKQRRETP